MEKKDRKVKGSMLVEQVRMVRANKHEDWSEYLNEEDWKVINSKILPANWYPLEAFQRSGWAVYKVLAKSNLDVVRASGRIKGEELFDGVYRHIASGDDPENSLDRFCKIYRTLFNFSTLRFEKIADRQAERYESIPDEDKEGN